MRDGLGATAATILLLPLALALAALGVYLLALSAAALVARPTRRPPAPRQRRFAVLVPAHDEASVVARLLASLWAQRYPRGRFDVFVVADNCTDETAAIARRSGAIVFERYDAQLRAKGHALRWLLERIPDRPSYDAYVVFDADSVVSSNFLALMDDHLDAGGRVLQGHYRVLNPRASPVSAIREAALASLHYLRPRGRAALGLSVGLKGNGMCFDARTLNRIGWSSVGLAEDVELHLAFVRAGVRTDFVPDAIVRADMPTTFRDATSQNLRWEAGRLRTVRSGILGMAREGLRTRNAMLVDAAVEQLIPPLSVAIAGGAAVTFVAYLAGATAVAVFASVGTVAIGVHVVVGLVAVSASAWTYLALLAAPPYIAWKVVLYARALLSNEHQGWVRTRRPAKPLEKST